MDNDKSVKISVTLPRKLLAQVDKLAQAEYFSRSAVIKVAVLEYLKSRDIAEVKRLEMLSDRVNKQRLDQYLNTINFDEIDDEP